MSWYHTEPPRRRGPVLHSSSRNAAWLTTALPTSISRRIGARRAVASLELILVAFPLLLMFVALLWMGAVGIQSGEVTVKVRHAAWLQRSSIAASPFAFSDFDQGRVQEQLTDPIDVSPLVNQLIIPSSEHTVFAGAWQNPHVDLNQSPNWQLIAKLGGKAGQQKLQSIHSGLASLRNLNWENAIANTAERLAGNHGSVTALKDKLRGHFLDWGNSTQANYQAQKEKAQEEVEKERITLQMDSSKKTAEIAQTQQRIEAKQTDIDGLRKNLKEATKDPNKNAAQIDLLKLQIKSQDEELKELQDRQQQLNKELGLLVSAQEQLRIAAGHVKDD